MNQNQHFVPQFYFRLFSNNENTIAMLVKRSGRLVAEASIRGQCAKPNFYGSKEIETLLSSVEALHADAIRALIQVVWNPSPVLLAPWALRDIWEAILLQRSRTELEVSKNSEQSEQIALEIFKHFVEHEKDAVLRKRALDAIAGGQITFHKDRSVTAREQIASVSNHTLLISDLDWCVLRNATDYPFIFGDAPVVFVNTYAKRVKNRGVLGLQCPGLQVFYPLDRSTLLMLYDGERYCGLFTHADRFDLIHRSDVSQLNLLQVHHSRNALYVGDPKDLPYLADLWNANGRTSSPPARAVNGNADFLVVGKPPDGRLIHMFERQLNVIPSLSFITVEPIAEADYHFSPRSPELHAAAKKEDDDFVSRD